MDIRIEATPMTMTVEISTVTVIAVKREFSQAIAHNGRVASFLRLLAIGGCSLSAVSPDDYSILIGGEAVAAA